MVGRVTAFAHQADTVGMLDSSRSFSGQTCFERQIGHVDVFNAVLQVAGEFEQAVQVQIETGVEVGLTRQTRNHLSPIGFGGIVLQQQLQGGVVPRIVFQLTLAHGHQAQFTLGGFELGSLVRTHFVFHFLNHFVMSFHHGQGLNEDRPNRGVAAFEF